jgi:hypothetical protein
VRPIWDSVAGISRRLPFSHIVLLLHTHTHTDSTVKQSRCTHNHVVSPGQNRDVPPGDAQAPVPLRYKIPDSPAWCPPPALLCATPSTQTSNSRHDHAVHTRKTPGNRSKWYLLRAVRQHGGQRQPLSRAREILVSASPPAPVAHCKLVLLLAARHAAH